MARIPLISGAYQSRAIISSSQRCINLYPEVNEDQQAPAPVTHFPTPGLTRRGTPPVPGITRCLFRSSNNQLFHVVGENVYYVSPSFGYVLLGSIPNHVTPVSMADNGYVIIMVDGSINGWAIKMTTNQFNLIADPSFVGGTHVAYLDTFFVFNVPGKNRWYISLTSVSYENLVNNQIDPDNRYAAIDPLDYADKIGSPDPVAGLITMHRNIWILGTLTGEAWYNSGAADFVFGALPGVYSENGCAAPYSIASEGLNVYWLAQSRRGRRTVQKWDAGFQAKTISKPGIEAILAKFAIVSDAIGGTYEILGHTYYVITFPQADRTFACETKSEQWHELAWTGPNGLERHRGQCWAFCYDKVLTGDRATGMLYELDPFNLTDNGGPITRIRTIPHFLNEGRRARIDRVIGDTQGGTLAGTTAGPYSKSIQQIITELGLNHGLALQLEAGNLSSWGGVIDPINRWLDLSATISNFFLGTAGLGTNEPTFHGAFGGQSLSEYWGFGGDDYFTFVGAANPAWIDDIHRDGAEFTIMALWLYAGPNADGIAVICGDTGLSNNNVGFSFLVNDVGNLIFQVGNGTAAAFGASAIAVRGDAPHVSAVSIKEGGGPEAGFLFHGGNVLLTFNPSYVSPAAGPAHSVVQIGANGGNAYPLVSGTRLHALMIWNVALTQAQVTALNDAIVANGMLPSPRFATPQIFLRISYDRGATFQDALPGSMGNEGEYAEMPLWTNLGIGRDIVLELSWSAPIDTALNGIFVEATPVGT